MQYQPETVLEHLVIHYRWVFVCLFLLPVSFVYDVWLYFRNWIVYRLSTAPKQHSKKVRKVQQQVCQINLIIPYHSINYAIKNNLTEIFICIKLARHKQSWEKMLIISIVGSVRSSSSTLFKYHLRLPLKLLCRLQYVREMIATGIKLRVLFNFMDTVTLIQISIFISALNFPQKVLSD